MTFGTWTGSFPSIGQTVFGDLNKFFSVGPLWSVVVAVAPDVSSAESCCCDKLDDIEFDVDGIAFSSVDDDDDDDEDVEASGCC
jgi:hypothetical protein